MTDVKVPGLGKMPKGAVIAVVIGGGVVVFLVVRNMRNSQAASQASTTGSGGQDGGGLSAQDGTTDSGIDPMTGFPVGSAADEQALASEGFSGLSSGFPIGDGTTGTGGFSSAPATNAQWSQEVQQTLTSIGYGSEAVANAVGRYLQHMPLTADQATIIQVAVAEVGPPPQGTYTIVQQPTGGGTGGTTLTVPNVVGLDQAQAFQVLQSEGFKPHGSKTVKGKVLTVDTQSPKAGAHAAKGSIVHLTSSVHGGLKVNPAPVIGAGDKNI